MMQSDSSVKNKKTVYTYFQEVSSINTSEQIEMICLWKESWASCGFDAVVLGLEHAMSHPGYVAFSEFVRNLPSCNPAGYDTACWLRWIAFASVGGGLMTDYDVIARSIDPLQIDKITQHVVLLDPSMVPCAVATKQNGHDLIVDKIQKNTHEVRLVGRRRHTSDMYFFQSSDWPCLGIVAYCSDSNPDFASVVHFSSSDCRRVFGRESRVKIIERHVKKWNPRMV